MAVYTPVSQAEGVAFAAHYGLKADARFTPIGAGVTNSNYSVHSGKDTYVLTLFEVPEDYPHLPFYLDVAAQASSSGLPCPRPLTREDGTSVGTLCGKPAALFTFLSGGAPKRIDPKRCASVGDALARFHSACLPETAQFPRLREKKPNIWGLDACIASAERLAPFLRDISPDIADATAEEIIYQQDCEARHGALPRGIIHGDLFPDNVLFEGTRVSGMLDVYFACDDVLLLDIAIAMNAWCFEKNDGDFNFSKASRLVRAYDAARPFSQDEAECLPRYARLAALRFMLSRYEALKEERDNPSGEDAVVFCHDPKEFYLKLLFHRNITSYRRYIDF